MKLFSANKERRYDNIEIEDSIPYFTFPPHRRPKGIDQLKEKGYKPLDYILDPHIKSRSWAQ